jgi:phosphate transport system protein
MDLCSHASFLMAERAHTNKQYEGQLRTLKEKLLLIGHKAEMAIADATRALIERKPSLAQHVIDEDDQVDQLELDIDDICFEILARVNCLSRVVDGA